MHAEQIRRWRRVAAGPICGRPSFRLGVGPGCDLCSKPASQRGPAEIITQLRDRSVRAARSWNCWKRRRRNWGGGTRAGGGEGEFAQGAANRGASSDACLPGPMGRLEEFSPRPGGNASARFSALLGQLHEAAEQGRWRAVVDLSEQVLAAAPAAPGGRARPRGPALEGDSSRSRWLFPRPPRLDLPHPPRKCPSAFLLWIDGIGGYLVCLGSRA